MGKLKLKKQNPNQLNEQTYFPVWGMYIPSFRTNMSMQRKNLKNILIATWGGVGDVACAEPAIRFAIEKWSKYGIEFSLATHHPDFFQHLKFKQVFDLKDKKNYPVWTNYFVFKTIYEESHLQWEFMNHMLCNSVEYIAMNMWRTQMPVDSRTIKFEPKFSMEKKTNIELIHGLDFDEPWVLVHAGSHWPIKTFPKWWWDAVLEEIKAQGVLPVLCGANAVVNTSKGADGEPERTGTVDVNTDGCVDLRNRTSINDYIWLCQQTKVLITNDSSPIHIAASGQAWIGFIATVKHPDFLLHWRQEISIFGDKLTERPQLGWRMKNFGLGGVWELDQAYDCPNATPDQAEASSIKEVPEELLVSWLPEPKEFAQWAVDKARS